MNILKKLFKKDDSYKSTNRLEELFMLAANNEAYRPEFYRQLFHFKLYVVGKVSEDGRIQLLNNQIDGGKYSYAYTSLSALRHANSNRKDGLPYIELDSLEFFKILASSELGFVLNADMDFVKVFTLDEVVAILNGEFENITKRVIEKDQKVQIGIPAKVPVQLIGAFKKFIKKNENTIKNIYFALKIERDELTYLAVVEFHENRGSNAEATFKDLSVILNEVGSDMPVDMTVVSDFYYQAFEAGSMLSCKSFKA